MPAGLSGERETISRAFGAEIMTIGDFHVDEALAAASDLGAQPGYFAPRQFDSEWNVEENRTWLGHEILEQLPNGAVPDAIVVGVGTGGTSIGVGQAFQSEISPLASSPLNRTARAHCCAAKSASTRSKGSPTDSFPGSSNVTRRSSTTSLPSRMQPHWKRCAGLQESTASPSARAAPTWWRHARTGTYIPRSRTSSPSSATRVRST